MHNISPTCLTEDSCSQRFDLAHINVTDLRYPIICPESVELIKANKAHRMDRQLRKLHVWLKEAWVVCLCYIIISHFMRVTSPFVIYGVDHTL